MSAGGDAAGGDGGDDDDALPDVPEVIELPITDELDLHAFAPADVADVVAEYLDAARARGLTTVRIVHGKGRGVQRRIVHGVLARHAAVLRYRVADETRGSWGATVVELAPPAPPAP